MSGSVLSIDLKKLKSPALGWSQAEACCSNISIRVIRFGAAICPRSGICFQHLGNCSWFNSPRHIIRSGCVSRLVSNFLKSSIKFLSVSLQTNWSHKLSEAILNLIILEPVQ